MLEFHFLGTFSLASPCCIGVKAILCAGSLDPTEPRFSVVSAHGGGFPPSGARRKALCYPPRTHAGPKQSSSNMFLAFRRNHSTMSPAWLRCSQVKINHRGADLTFFCLVEPYVRYRDRGWNAISCTPYMNCGKCTTIRTIQRSPFKGPLVYVRATVYCVHIPLQRAIVLS